MSAGRDERPEGSWLVAVALSVLVAPLALAWCVYEWLRVMAARWRARR